MCEAVWVQLTPRSSRTESIVVCCTYRPPSTRSLDITRYCDMIGDSLRMIPVSSSHVIIAGDVNGEKNSLWCSTDHTCPAGAAIQREFGCFGLQQLVATSTHTAPSGLDLTFSNRRQLVSSIDTVCALGASDHLLILCHFAVPMDPLPSCASSRDWVQVSSARKYNFKRVTFGRVLMMM